MTDYSHLPIVYLYTRNREAIEGATRFQKLVFLGQEEENLANTYSYHADRYGPFSPDLHRDLEALQLDGYIEREVVKNEVGNEKYVFTLTMKGIEKAQDLLSLGNESYFNTVQRVKTEYNNTPLQNLLRYVYHNYPDYATETELDVDRLFDPDARSQFLQPGEKDFVGTEPGEWKELNPSADEFFSTD